MREELDIVNTDRTVGTILSHQIAKKWGMDCLPDDTVHFKLNGIGWPEFWCIPGEWGNAGIGEAMPTTTWAKAYRVVE